MDYKLNDSDRLQLQKMISANETEDQTQLIRNVKHSKQIREEVNAIYALKRKYPRLQKENKDQFEKMCLSKCNFLFTHYTDIYNRVFKDELDPTILNKFLDALQLVEEGKVDQHEASVKVGAYLKELYVDSALKKADKNDAQANKKDNTPVKNPKNISWDEYKQKHL